MFHIISNKLNMLYMYYMFVILFIFIGYECILHVSYKLVGLLIISNNCLPFSTVQTPNSQDLVHYMSFNKRLHYDRHLSV